MKVLLKVLFLGVLVSCTSGYARLTSDGYQNGLSEQITTRMVRDNTDYRNVTKPSATVEESLVSDCVTLIGQSGVVGGFSKCKMHVQEAVKFCQSSAAVKSHVVPCKKMLVNIRKAINKCELQAGKPGELCVVIQKSKANCKAVAGSISEPWCINASLNKRSNTEPLPWPEAAASLDSATEQSAIDVVVHTIPIGQGDCNIITCNSGKNVIIFDCGSRGGNVFQENNNFNFILKYFVKVEMVTVLISHGDRDHYNQIENILHPVIQARNPMIKAQLGGPLDDYDSDFRNWLKSVTASGQFDFPSTDFCHNFNIQFTLHSTTGYRLPNQNGLLMKLTCNTCQSQLLFPGDMEGRAANDMAKNHASFLRSTHYKMAHHGASRIANMSPWLEAISPVEVHISHVFRNTLFRHPRCKAIYRILQLNTVGTTDPHPFICYGSERDFQTITSSRIFSTAPRRDKLCLIELTFTANSEATTRYYCNSPEWFLE